MFFGISIGAFGLFGKEIMNRRFGQISLIAYSSRSLPVSEKKIFLVFFIKDILFYLFLWIIPICTGFLLTSSFIDFNFIQSLFACGTLILSFLLGISIVFFLSTFYAHSKALLLIVIITIIGVFLSQKVLSTMDYLLVLPYQLYYTQSLKILIVIVSIILITSILSIIFVKIEYSEKKKHYSNKLSSLTKKLGFSKYSYYIAKDFLDLHRSEGGLGKIIFSFLLPIVFTYFFLSIFLTIIPTIKILIIFGIFLSVVSSTIYNMITEFDTFQPYLSLPVHVSTILKSKIISFLLINLFSVMVLFIAAITMNQLDVFLQALFLFISTSVFILSVTIYFTGLQPNLLLYESKIFLSYALVLAPLIFLLTIVSILNPNMTLISPILIPISWIFFKKSFKKWDTWNPMNI
jgi:hypothetical protein